MGRRGRRYKQLLDDLKGTRGYWKLKEEALDDTLWGTHFQRGHGPAARQQNEWHILNMWIYYSQKICSNTFSYMHNS
jgi:hypothetical protein